MMIRLGHLAIVSAFIFSGCSAIERPELTSERVLPLEALVTAISCELSNSIRKIVARHKEMEDWQGVYTITYKTTQTGFGKITASTFPLKLPHSSTLDLGVTGGATTTATKIGVLNFDINFKDAGRRAWCVPTLRPDGHPFLTGEIGFDQWFTRAIEATEHRDGQVPNNVTSIGHTFEFDLDWGAAISPSFTLNPAPPILITPQVSFDKSDDNKVEVAFAKVPKTADKEEKVELTLSADQIKSLGTAMTDMRAANHAYASASVEATRVQAQVAQAKADIALQRKEKEEQEAMARSKNDNGSGNGITEKAASAYNANMSSLQTFIDDGGKRLKDLETQKVEASLNKRDAELRYKEVGPPARKESSTRTVSHPSPLAPGDNPNITSTLLSMRLDQFRAGAVP